jgi:hypothetical protein
MPKSARPISNFLSLYQCSKEEIEEYEALIRERNQFAHASGKILDEENIDSTIQRYIAIMDKIQNKSTQVVKDCFELKEEEYFEFLEEGNQVAQEFTLTFLEPFLFSRLDIMVFLELMNSKNINKLNEIKIFLDNEGIITIENI